MNPTCKFELAKESLYEETIQGIEKKRTRGYDSEDGFESYVDRGIDTLMWVEPDKFGEYIEYRTNRTCCSIFFRLVTACTS